MFQGRGGNIVRRVVAMRMLAFPMPSLCGSSPSFASIALGVGPALSIAVRAAATTAKKKEQAPRKKRSSSAARPTARNSTARKKSVADRAAPVLTECDDEALGDESNEAMDETAAALEEEWRKMRESDSREAEDDEEYKIIDKDEVEEDTTPVASRRRRRTSEAKEEYLEAEEEDGGAAADDAVADSDASAPAQVESRFLKDRFPDLAAEYDTASNKEPIDTIYIDSAPVVTWKCVDCGFKWKSGVFVRTCLRTKCPACEKKRNPPLSSRFVQMWDHAMNDPCVDPKTVLASSYKSAHWRCPTCSTSYQARIKDVVADKAPCPSCSLLNLHADFSKDEFGLLQEWHPLKNGDLQPSQVKPTDLTKLWWLCMSCGHEWEATLAARLAKRRRTRGKECPVCLGKGKGQ